MVPYYGSRLTRAATLSQDKTLTFDWDVVSYPVMQKGGRGPQFDAQVYFVSKTSKHPDEAFQIISLMTSSIEAQTNIAKIAKARPAIKLEQLESVFGADFPILKQKNIKGIFKVEPSERNIANTI
jgi:ABC-type glycerol-3-phosphate transport system substrate-binding protein